MALEERIEKHKKFEVSGSTVQANFAQGFQQNLAEMGVITYQGNFGGHKGARYGHRGRFSGRGGRYADNWPNCQLWKTWPSCLGMLSQI